MRHPIRLVVLLVLPAAAVFAASADPGAEDVEGNARLVQQYRHNDPAYYERLRRDLRAFSRLPRERQERLRQLDRALHEQDSATQSRLKDVLDRFEAWLEQLPEEDRRRVEDAPNREERLRVIKELREEEFVRRLPQKVRATLERLAPEERAREIARLREEERQLRLAWDPNGRPAAERLNKPVRPADLSPEAQDYLKRVLEPMLSDAEKKQLKDAEGQWPLFARTLLDLAERHPVLLPPGRWKGPTRPADLKGDLRVAFNTLTKDNQKNNKNVLQSKAGQWPEFAREMTKLARRDGVRLPKQLGPCRPDDFLEPVQGFITGELQTRLSDAEKADLKKAEGHWPEYPDLLMKLAQVHGLDIPMMRLPGGRELFDRVRAQAELPEVPNRTLREFYVLELSEEEREQFPLAAHDPASREWLVQEYWKRHPNQLRRMHGIDQRKFAVKK